MGWRSMFQDSDTPMGGQGGVNLPSAGYVADRSYEWHPTPLGRIFPGGNDPGRYDLSPDVLSQGPRSALEALLADDQLEEVVHNGSHQPMIVYHREFGDCVVNLLLPKEDARAFLEDVAAFNDAPLDIEHPLLEGNLPDGSRICAAVPPVTGDFETFTVRKLGGAVTNLLDILRTGALSSEAAAFLWCVVDGFSVAGANLLVVGGSASGKTTMLNALLQFIPKNQRMVTIEDVRELRPNHPNHVALRSSQDVDMQDLLRNALRQRPDRIVVGEVRGPEANVLFTAMNTGHQGCMGTLHARSVHRVADRVTTPPMSVPLANLRGLDLLINQARRGGGGSAQRACVEIAEVAGVASTCRLQSLFRWDSMRRRLVRTSSTSRFRAKLCEAASMSVMEFENVLAERTAMLDEALRTGSSFEDLLQAIRVANENAARATT